MTPIEYQRLAMRSANVMDKDKLLVNAALGCCGEAGEFADMIKKHLFQGHDIDRDHLVKEIGDELWYIAAKCEALGVTLDEVMEINIDKLRKRYPDGFDADRSRTRRSDDV